MDELQLVRELFDERPPPRPEVIAEARAQLSAPGPHRQAPPRRGPRAQRPPVSLRWPGRRLVLGAGVPIAAAAAAVVAVAVTVPGPAAGHSVASLGVYRPGGPAAPSGAGRPGQPVLLAAARTVAQATPARGGRYWVTSSAVGNFIRVGPAGDRYLILERTGVQNWAARNPRVLSQRIVQPTGVQLASAADHRAWRRAGSPGRWDVGVENGLASPAGFADGGTTAIQAGRGKLVMDFGETGDPFVAGSGSYTARSLLRLPAGPAQLKALLMTGYQRDYGSITGYLFWAAPKVLTLPVTPQTRAGLYRLLAGLPGVRSLGHVRDAAGQAGEAVAISGRYRHCGHWARPLSADLPWTFASCTVQQRLVIDPATGGLLALELRYLRLPPGQSWSAPDGLFSFQIFGTSRWTSTRPPATRPPAN